MGEAKNGPDRRLKFIKPSYCIIRKKGQVSKATEHAHLFPAINVSKWRTTNEISPRILTSHQAARTFVQILIIG